MKIKILLKLFLLVSGIWIIYGAFILFSTISQSCKNYSSIAKLSLEDKRAAITGWDFYQFLMFCDKTIPERKDVRWVFPKGNFLGNSEYHFFKAYYYLYPRNFREDASYIMVYERPDYAAPAGYKVMAEYEKDKYILSRINK